MKMCIDAQFLRSFLSLLGPEAVGRLRGLEGGGRGGQSTQISAKLA